MYRFLNRHILSLFIAYSPFLMVWTQEYNFNAPHTIIQLDQELREISDITSINNQTIACVQDERGVLFTYSLKKQNIESRDSFYVAGDYEGITRDKNYTYILRSDGLILVIKYTKHSLELVDSIITGVPTTNNEGLCYDKSQHDLLIASKSRSNVAGKEWRCIYRFDLDQQKLLSEPYLEINNIEIQNRLIEDGLNDSLAKRVRFKPSAITIQPRTNKFYVLSATAKLICIYSKKTLVEVIQLDPVIYNKAEGICFHPNGELMISNEGQNGSPTIVIIRPNSLKKLTLNSSIKE